MHNRRLGAFLIGAWLAGAVLVWFTTSQALLNVDRTLSTPPQQVHKEFEDMGPEVSRQILRHEAMQLNRRVTETWEIVQLGIAAALLAASVLTIHRSKVAMACAFLLGVMAAISAFYLTPNMNALGRSFDFVPGTAMLRERELFQRLQVWHTVLTVLSTIVALIVTARLLFDLYEFRDKFLPPATTAKVRRKRRRRSRQDTGGQDDNDAAEPDEAHPSDAARGPA